MQAFIRMQRSEDGESSGNDEGFEITNDL